MSNKQEMPKEVSDSIAERLEAAGLWRRATARWLVVMGHIGHTDVQREWLRLRRQYCQSMVTPAVVAPEKLDIAAINLAANAAQVRMGIARPEGAMFRRYPEGKSR